MMKALFESPNHISITAPIICDGNNISFDKVSFNAKLYVCIPIACFASIVRESRKYTSRKIITFGETLLTSTRSRLQRKRVNSRRLIRYRESRKVCMDRTAVASATHHCGYFGD